MVFKKKEKVLETKDEDLEFVHCKINRKCNDIIHNGKLINVKDGMIYVRKETYEELKEIGEIE